VRAGRNARLTQWRTVAALQSRAWHFAFWMIESVLNGNAQVT
jgi:hypothetical protein